MDKEINLLKNNRERDWTDLEWVNEFYKFLQGDTPKEISAPRGHFPKLNEKKAFSIIWYLQEHFSILPDHIEQCSNCGCLYDENCEGLFWETKGKNYCGACDYLVPANYDRGRK